MNANPNFPAAIEDIPFIAFDYEDEVTKSWENQEYWGGFYQREIAESGIEKCVGSCRDMVEDLRLNFVCAKEVVRDNHFEPLIEGIGDNRVVVFEQFESKVSHLSMFLAGNIKFLSSFSFFQKIKKSNFCRSISIL